MKEGQVPRLQEGIPDSVTLQTLFAQFQERGLWQRDEVLEVLQAAAEESLGIDDDLSQHPELARCQGDRFGLWTLSPEFADAVIGYLNDEYHLDSKPPTKKGPAPAPRVVVELPQAERSPVITVQTREAQRLEELADALLSDADRDAERERRWARAARPTSEIVRNPSSRSSRTEDPSADGGTTAEGVVEVVGPPVREQLQKARARLLAREHGDAHVRELRAHQIDFINRFDHYFLALTESSDADQPSRELNPGNPVTPFARIEAAPRTGKTTVAAEMIRRTDLKTVYFVPYVGLAYQAERELQSLLPDKKIAVYIGERKDTLTDADIVISTYNMSQWQMGMHEELPKAFQHAPLIFTDEGHESTTDRRMDVLRRGFDADALRIALTGTPDYSERRRLRDSYPTLIHQLRTPEAFSLDLLSPFEYFVYEIDVDASKVAVEETSAGPEYDQKKLAQKMNQAPVNELILHVRQDGANRGIPTIVTVSGKGQAEDVTLMLQERGFRAACVVDDTPNRQEILQQYEDGQLDTLVTVRVLLRGWDSPRCKLLIDAAPGISPVNAGQKYTRPMTKNGEDIAKMHCIVPKNLPVTPLFPPDVLINLDTPLPPGVICRPNKKNEKDPKAHTQTERLQFSGMAVRPVFDLRDYGRAGKIEIDTTDTTLLRSIIMTGIQSTQDLRYDEPAFIDLISHYRYFQNTAFDHPKFKGYGQLLLWSAGVASEGDFIAFMNRAFPTERAHAIDAYGTNGPARGFGSRNESARHAKIAGVVSGLHNEHTLGMTDVSDDPVIETVGVDAISEEYDSDRELLESDVLFDDAIEEKLQEVREKHILTDVQYKLLEDYLKGEVEEKDYPYKLSVIFAQIRRLFPDVKMLRGLNARRREPSEAARHFEENRQAIKYAILSHPDTPTVWKFMSLLSSERVEYCIDLNGKSVNLSNVADRLGLGMYPASNHSDFAYLCKVIFSEAVLNAAEQEYIQVARPAFEAYLQTKQMPIEEWLLQDPEKIRKDSIEVDGKSMTVQVFIKRLLSRSIDGDAVFAEQIHDVLSLLYSPAERRAIYDRITESIKQKETEAEQAAEKKLRERQALVIKAFREDPNTQTPEKALRFFLSSSANQIHYNLKVSYYTLNLSDIAAMFRLPFSVARVGDRTKDPELVHLLEVLFESDSLQPIYDRVAAELDAEQKEREVKKQLRDARLQETIRQAMEKYGPLEYWVSAPLNSIKYLIVDFTEDNGYVHRTSVYDTFNYKNLQTYHGLRDFLRTLFGEAAVNEAYQKKYENIQESEKAIISTFREDIERSTTMSAFVWMDAERRRGWQSYFQRMLPRLKINELDVVSTDEDFYTFARILFGPEQVDPIINQIKLRQQMRQ